jgi:hypothetical protein
MKFLVLIVLSTGVLFSCIINKKISKKQYPTPILNLEQANRLAQLPIKCVNTEFPYKLGQTLGSADDLKTPKQLHPAFYGCFDWHSAVHGHWAMVNLLKHFPSIDSAETLRHLLKSHITKENIAIEVAYFHGKHNKSWERTYGWAWLLKLTQELHTWDDPLAHELEANLKPLSDLIEQKFVEFLPKLYYNIRVGEHPNTAFGMVFAYDYALAMNDELLKDTIEKRARHFYLTDNYCPLSWEPGGFDFLSPCLEEIDIMRRVLEEKEFHQWFEHFLPQMRQRNFDLNVGVVADRTDGKLVHLDGLNFTRAWVLYGLVNQYPQYKHLLNIANKHMQYSLPNLVSDSYEGGHWLGSFALYALNMSQGKE